MTRQKVAALLIAMICMMFPFSPVLAQKPRSQSPGVISFKDKAAQVRQQMPSMRQAWLAASDPDTKKKLGREMVDQAVHYKDDEEYDGLIYEVAAGGPIAALEIKIPAKTKAVKVKSGLTITSFDRQKFTAWTWHWTEAAPFIERRITKNAVEVWTPKEGWLFSGRGKLLNHATVPRRDGKGQQWYGAFRPDGCWVTTALWERDDTLFLYAKNGKFL
jgi:hypothetical protein